MNTLVGSLVAAALVLELLGLVGLAMGHWSLGSVLTLWGVAVGLLVLARGLERFETPTSRGYDADLSR